MNISYRLFSTLLFTLLLSGAALAQTRQPTAAEQAIDTVTPGPKPQTQAPTVTVTATASQERVRYVSIGEVRETRLQVFAADGAQIYDSAFKLGNLIDWSLSDQQGTRLADGTYLFLVTVKDFGENLTQRYGVAQLEQEQVYVERVAREELTSAQVTALETNSQAELLSAVDRFGAAGLGRTGEVTTDSAQTDKKSSTSATGGENITGTGTQNFIAKWIDNAGTLGDSIISEQNSRIGIGTANPGAKLHVVGIAGSLGAGSFQLDTPTLFSNWTATYPAFEVVNANKTNNNVSLFQFADAPSGASHAGVGAVNTDHVNKYGQLFFYTKQPDGYQIRMGIYGNGNVGIGTTSPSLGKLQVNGGNNTAVYASTSGLELSAVNAFSQNGTGVMAQGASGVSGSATVAGGYGVVGANNLGGTGVYGVNNGGHTGAGVYGISFYDNGKGVYGFNSGGYEGYGVYGQSDSDQGIGVLGTNTSTTGITYGVYASSFSSNGFGVYAWNGGGGVALYSETTNPNSYAGYFQGKAVVTSGSGATNRGLLNVLSGSGNANLYIQGAGGSSGINFGVDSSSNLANAKLFIAQYDGTTYRDRIIITQTGTVQFNQLGTAGATQLCLNASNELSSCSSSLRYKTNVATYSPGLNLISRLRPISFNWKANHEADLGLAAEEVAQVEPRLVNRNASGQVEGVKYDRLNVLLVNAVKEQQKEIEQLKARLAKVERGARRRAARRSFVKR